MNERIKQVNKLLEKALKLNLDLDKITEGKSKQTLARSTKTLDNLKKRFARQKERPKILAQVEKYESELKKKKLRKLITKETKAEFKWNDDLKGKELTDKLIKNEVNRVSNEFLQTFFKQIKHESEAQKKIKKLQKRFGLRLDIVYDFMDHIADYSFKYEMDRDFMREEMPEDFASLLYQRLDEFDRILNTKFKI